MVEHPNFPIVLASASPRRQELLKQLFDTFTVDPADIDEDALTTSDPTETAEDLALAKAQEVSKRHPEALVIGSDTVVALETEEGWVQYAKPSDSEDAFRILSTLSGKTHWVITGVAVVGPRGSHVSSDSTGVTFKALSPDSIWEYIRTGNPMDKAGAYGAQVLTKDPRFDFLQALDGRMDTVIGLPVDLVQSLVAAYAQSE
jgi:septum formation protein